MADSYQWEQKNKRSKNKKQGKNGKIQGKQLEHHNLLNFTSGRSDRAYGCNDFRYIEIQYYDYIKRGKHELADKYIREYSKDVSTISQILSGLSGKFACKLFEHCPDQRIIDWLAMPEIDILLGYDAYGDIVTCFRIRFMGYRCFYRR